jgi:DNA replication protein DnaC
VRYYFAGDWFSELQKNVSYGRDDARGWVEASAARPLVILDDLGQEALLNARAEWASDWFFRFIDLRIGWGLPLIVSTNLNAVEMARGLQGREGVGREPLMRRLVEICDVVKF